MKNAKLLVLPGSVVALILVLFLLARQEERARTPLAAAARKPRAFEMGIPTAREIQSLVRGYGSRVDAAEKEIRALRETLSAQREEFARAVETSRAEQEEIRLQAEHVEISTDPPKSPPRFRKFEFQPPAAADRSVRIPAGSFAEATLLTGVYAPVNGQPLPVLLRLDAALIGPVRTRVPLRDAFLVGKAQGDANSERAVVQLESLSFVTPSGRSVETRVNGWVVDRDGVQGLQGTYVWRGETIAALAAAAGGLSAGADALAARQTTTTASPLGSSAAVTGDPLRFAGYRGASAAMEEISEIIARRMEEMVPAVYVPNGRRVTVAFISGATLDGLAPKEAGHGPNAGPFDGLDLDR